MPGCKKPWRVFYKARQEGVLRPVPGRPFPIEASPARLARPEQAPLFYHEATQELVCKASRLAYPVRDGIPVLLEEEARELAADDPLLAR